MVNSKFQKYDLNNKVDTFIIQYDKAVKQAHIFTDIGEFHFPRELRDFIESKAVYSELRWPQVYGTRSIAGNEHTSEEDLTWERFDELKPLHKSTGLPGSVDQQVLYRIIERGGNRIGARRGLLFAQDFGLDVNVPVAYSVDWSDPHLYDFLEPLIPQLNLDTVCPVDYFARNSDNLRNVEEVRLEEVLSKLLFMELRRKTA